jgi:hypothetical protein
LVEGPGRLLKKQKGIEQTPLAMLRKQGLNTSEWRELVFNEF